MCAVALALGASLAAPSAADATVGDLVVVAPPAPVLPDDSAAPLDLAMSGNGRYVAVVEQRSCVSLPPSYDYAYDCYPEQHIWRYDLQTGARPKIDKGGFALGGARTPVLNSDGSVAAWTSFYWFPDGDTTHVFRSRPDTGKSGQDLIPYAGGQGPDGKWYPEFVTASSMSDDGHDFALDTHYYGGSCSFPGFLWSSDDFTGATPPFVKQLTSGCDAEDRGQFPVGEDQIDTGTYFPKISGDGSTIVFSSGDALYRYDVASGTFDSIPLPAAVPTSDPRSSSLALSADGSTIAYVTGNSADDYGNPLGSTLWIADSTSGAATAVASFNNGEDPVRYVPSLSADGRYLAFDWPHDPVTGTATGTLGAYVYDRASGTTKRVSQRPSGTPFAVADATNSGPKISSDGRYVSFIADNAHDALPDPSTPASKQVVRVDVLGEATDTTAPPRPASIKVKKGSTSTVLSWPAVTDNGGGTVLYRIRQRPISGATHPLIGMKVQTGTSLTLRGLVAGQPYRFAVTAEDPDGNRSTATTVSLTAPGITGVPTPTVTAPTKPYAGTAEQQLGGSFTINGTNLAGVTSVLVGTKLATGLNVTSNKITGTAPRTGDAASVPVTLIGPFGAKAAGRFYYRPPGASETGD